MIESPNPPASGAVTRWGVKLKNVYAQYTFVYSNEFAADVTTSGKKDAGSPGVSVNPAFSCFVDQVGKAAGILFPQGQPSKISPPPWPEGVCYELLA
jgi:hypothetical protein